MFRLGLLCLWLLSVSINADDCMSCHPNEAKKCQNNIHYTLHKAINITRNAWGIKDSNVTLQTLPQPPHTIEKVSDLVDDFLRRKCLKCHLDAPKPNEQAQTCLSCHEPHHTKGKCQTHALAMDKCLNCHNKNFVGGDYLGLFPKDHHQSYRAPLAQNGFYPEQKYGIDYHHLNEDIHFQKGLTCKDCHTAKEMQSERKASCADCHKKLSLSNHTAHHKKVSCSACHASWNNNSYELSVFRDDTADYGQWKELTLQEDEYLTHFLQKALKSKQTLAPQMPDWITHEMKEGVWYSGYRYKRWEHFNLANSDDGRIKIIRPLFQYRISYRDKNGTMIFDDVREIDGKKIEAWVPYSPHTIGAHAKSCEQCHENPLILNPLKTGNEVFDLQRPETIVNGTALSPEQIQKLHSSTYRKIRAKMLAP